MIVEIGKKYTIAEFYTPVIAIYKDDNKKMAFVTADTIDKKGGFWVNYKKLKQI